MKYAEYIAENLDKNIDYSEYIAENLDSNIDYSEYIAENLDSNIAYSEYIAENLDNDYSFYSEQKMKQELRKKKINNIMYYDDVDEKDDELNIDKIFQNCSSSTNIACVSGSWQTTANTCYSATPNNQIGIPGPIGQSGVTDVTGLVGQPGVHGIDPLVEKQINRKKKIKNIIEESEIKSLIDDIKKNLKCSGNK